MERLQWVLLRALLENFGLLFLSKSGHTEGIYHILPLLYYTSEERERGSLSVNVCARSRVDKVYPRFHCSERVKESKRERERERKGGREWRRDPSFER